ncbi:MAG: peptidase T [Clostridia bacterium]|nr:peptidase T [Clostridia bacterium]
MNLTERFLRYVSFPTMSDESSLSCPSTEKQLLLGRVLQKELSEMGLDSEIDENGYVYGSLPSNCGAGHPSIAFIAHMDTSDAVADSPINPRVLKYTGGEIVLSEADNIVSGPLDDSLIGLNIIVTDGKTLLGADDKAGIAEIMDALARLIESGEPHGDIKICFTPDEEIGRGADLLNLEKLGADYGYTLDGGELGGIEYENFNAASATVSFRGFSTHPGGAFGIMKNAASIAAEFASRMPSGEVPEKTKGYEGFYHLTDMSGSTEEAVLRYIIRDHDREKFENKKKFMASLAKEIGEKYGEDCVSLDIKDSYYNMKEIIEKHPYVLRRAEEAMKAVGVTPYSSPIRGGTDGARLSFMGLPCPNLCTGGHMFHSRFEFAVAEHMQKCSDIALRLMLDGASFEK